MKTVLKEIFEYIDLNDNSKEMYLVDWFEQNKTKLLEAEKIQIETAYNSGWTHQENRTKGNKYFGNNYYTENYESKHTN